jgi:thiamine kinase-like enzyme
MSEQNPKSLVVRKLSLYSEFQCDVCDLIMVTNHYTSIWKHQKRCRQNTDKVVKTEFKCEFCNAYLKSKRYLKSHLDWCPVKKFRESQKAIINSTESNNESDKDNNVNNELLDKIQILEQVVSKQQDIIQKLKDKNNKLLEFIKNSNKN